MDYAGRTSWAETVQREGSWQQRLRDSGHPAFELTGSWPGWRMIGDVTWVNEAVESVGVAHGLGDPLDGPTVHVHTTTLPSETMAESLLARADLRLHDGLRRDSSDVGLMPLEGVTVEVEGTRLTALRGIETANGWLIEVATDGPTVYIEGHGLPRGETLRVHGLRQVAGFEPLFAERLELLRRLRGGDT